MKKIAILGSTGSIGKSALELFDGPLSDYKVIALSANDNAREMLKQAKKYKPKYIAMLDTKAAEFLKKKLKGIKVLSGMEGLIELAVLQEADVILLSVVGAVGMVPLLSAIRKGKTIALANKEALIIAGELIKKEVKKYGATILPVDSEHNAVFQAMQGNKKEYIKKLIITASGGPLKNTPFENFKKISVEQALAHPTWKMGRKITIDSSTLMNKGLEVIEAHYLFDIPFEKIEVVIHPQSIVHSLVEYIDGSVMAQLSNPDMKLPIMYALTYPERRQGIVKPLNLAQAGRLEFYPVDFTKFKAFSIALKAGKAGGTMPACMNAANETAVHAFLEKRITFDRITDIVEKTVLLHKNIKNPNLEQILKTDLLSRQAAEEIING
ncbi:MAG: 1-deoxy-D-xylulose-5-phosphate reductoisomerase [Candidatus Goldbacteria bacterium]|nr:1-deoxy-D-xylulose-5-phosphate reductoisomerase [Candidatus Goldiibacteriota bacterium]